MNDKDKVACYRCGCTGWRLDNEPDAEFTNRLILFGWVWNNGWRCRRCGKDQ